jgi:hypothetical protein
MRKLIPVLLASVFSGAALSLVTAQAPPGKQQQKDFSDSSIVTRMMAFNKKKDGKLTKDEVTDPRLHRLFDLADANKDGVVTRDELIALAAKLDAEFGEGGGPKGKGPGGFGGKGPPKGKKKKGPGGPDGPGAFGPPRLGLILPPFLQDELSLSADQKRQLNELQKEVDGKLDRILTREQRQQLEEMRQRKKRPPVDDR